MKFVILLVCLVVISLGQHCRWARSFNATSLLRPIERDRFLDLAAFWEGKFHSHSVGINEHSGMTYDGRRINYDTGALDALHFWTASSKESLHLNMIAMALNGNRRARIFFHSSSCPSSMSYTQCMDRFAWQTTKQTIFNILTNKIRSYNAFNARTPGFGGQIPWVIVNDTGFVPDTPWVKRTPGLDNGQLLFSIYALNHVLEQDKSPQAQKLHRAYTDYLDMMSRSAPIIFYEGQGKIRTVSVIKDVNARPTPDNYQSENPCGHPCFLDDPYEGELMAFWFDLFNRLPDREEIWNRKRPKLKSVTYPSKEGPLTCPQGHWFSAHEQWKYLYLPYGDVPVVKKLIQNSEKTINSFEKNIPGMYASVTNVTHGIGGPGGSGYLSACGVQEVAVEKVVDREIITPYGAYSVFLANQTVGAIWYHHILQVSKMQNLWGSTEAIKVDGKRICPLLTWDSKILTIVGMEGGIIDIVRDRLKKDGVYERFMQIVNREWGSVFTNIQGEKIEYKLPNTKLPDLLGVYDNCRD